VRQVWPDHLPLAVRISAIDWKEGGWDIEQSIALAKLLKAEGVDLMDCSSGGVVPDAKITVGPGYQVPFAEKIRRGADIATAAVGFITEPKQADDIVRQGQADVVLLARQMLVDPYWPAHAAESAGLQTAAAESIRTGLVSGHSDRVFASIRSRAPLWRRLVICCIAGWQPALCPIRQRLPIANRRHGRLPACATLPFSYVLRK
jgi:2,4-dienoyl-CoA reductase-like NADH-dependent reductase (Old Yellow Enzyme family)